MNKPPLNPRDMRWYVSILTGQGLVILSGPYDGVEAAANTLAVLTWAGMPEGGWLTETGQVEGDLVLNGEWPS